MIYKIVRLFLNALTADNKNYLLKRDNLTQIIQMQLSQKQKLFPNFFSFFFFLHFSNLYEILNIFQKQIILIADVFQNVKAPQHVVRQMSKNSFFMVPFNRQHGKWVETLLESERQHLYHIY